MKKTILASAIAFMACSAAHADNEGVYIGVKGGSFQIDIEDASDPTGYGALIGYNFGRGPAIEFEYTNSDSINIGGGYGGYYYGSLEIETVALYFAYRTQGTVFFKARAGLLKEDVTSNQFSKYNDSETGLSAGVGVGVNMGSVAQLEAEYTIIEQDVSLLSLGFNLRF